MTRQTPPLYALLPITETEGLPNDQYRLVDKYGRESDVKYSFADGQWLGSVVIKLYHFTHYLRPLPEGTVAVSEEELRELVCDARERPYPHTREQVNEIVTQFITSKLAQMGE